MTKVLVFGTFDILHPGHVYFLNQSKKLGDFLYVVVSRDETVKELKGKYPENDELARLGNIKKVSVVNQAILGNLEDKYKVLEKIKPDIIALGYDQKFFTDNLEQEVGKRKIDCRIVRLGAYQPKKYKSSIFKNQSGFLLINKPEGPTSHDIIDKLRKITGIRKIGHAGTLDPFASGLLIVGVGREATRRISGFVKLDKKYVAKLRLGYVSDSYDRTGEVHKNMKTFPPEADQPLAEKHENKLSKSTIGCVLQGFVGEQMQVPPMYSAKKVGGRKLYELARRGEEIERELQKIIIYQLLIISYEFPYLTIEVHCSSGTYIRALANDIGEKLKTGAYVLELKRTQIGEYKIEDAIEPEDLTKEDFKKYFL